MQVQQNLAAGAHMKEARAQRSEGLRRAREQQLASNQQRAAQVQEERAAAALAAEHIAQPSLGMGTAAARRPHASNAQGFAALAGPYSIPILDYFRIPLPAAHVGGHEQWGHRAHELRLSLVLCSANDYRRRQRTPARR